MRIIYELYLLSHETKRPLFPISWAMWLVFPPGAAQRSIMASPAVRARSGLIFEWCIHTWTLSINQPLITEIIDTFWSHLKLISFTKKGWSRPPPKKLPNLFPYREVPRHVKQLLKADSEGIRHHSGPRWVMEPPHKPVRIQQQLNLSAARLKIIIVGSPNSR